ncbi:uncharacterized protein [Physcomitrium patens]|uniref:uncharacterized protein isoform X2 n=1 Tax=Physcomitrium patens TaxID=3218 RepID=UPI000D168FB6|nr:RNA polymerase II degradation factor 1-like isoform X2 [Physcomitrium patens]|eukprot:XP_024382642.1 RNA polymerase II degradation factor 1-like isoform X2 [Physcomitrella patens]
MEQDGQAHEGQPQQAQHDQQGGVGSNPQQNPQEQAKVASQEAVVAQQEAQEAIKRAYVKQMAAQEKAERASQQVVTEQETAKKVATEAASEAAEKAANEQRERGAKEAHDMSIANLAAQSALASLSASQSANQQRPVNPGYQSGFVAYSSRDQNSASATQGQGARAVASTKLRQRFLAIGPALSTNVTARCKSDGATCNRPNGSCSEPRCRFTRSSIPAGGKAASNGCSGRNGVCLQDCSCCSSSRHCGASRCCLTQSLQRSINELFKDMCADRCRLLEHFPILYSP